MADSQLPITIDEENAVDLYSQKELDKALRPEMIDIARMSYGKLLELLDKVNNKDAETIYGMSSYQVSWLRLLIRAAVNGEMPAISFMQEQVMGKALQRIQSETVTYTYQDLLHRIRKAENKYKIVIGEVVEEPKKKTWADLL